MRSGSHVGLLRHREVAARVHQSGDAEVRELRVAGPIFQQDVARLQIAVDDASLARVVECR
jgi:hypothetical protein